MSSSTPTPPPKSLLPFDVLFDNPVFAGGAGLAGLGAAAALGRRGVIAGAGAIKRRLLVNLEISKQDKSYQWILAWLSLPRPPAGRLISSFTRINDLSMITTFQTAENRIMGTSFKVQPGFGRYIVRHNNAFISVLRQKQGTGASLNGTEPHETITLTTLYAHKQIFEDIFTEAHALAQSQQAGKTIMYKSESTEWKPVGDARQKRSLDSVILNIGVKERIVADVENFLASQKWYTDRGIPYRRGYLLYGPPGSGKSSFIYALAGELDLSIAIINLNERGLTDDRLASLITKLPPRSILLLEDADGAFANRRKTDADGYNGPTVTFSGLLNALDGVAAGEERIAFLTTNHIERLDEALIRPGRVDMAVRIGEATRYQVGEMWDRFYGPVDHDGKLRTMFLQKVESLGLLGEGEKPGKFRTSTAALQGLFLYNKDTPEKAIEMAEGLIPRIYEAEEHPAGLKVPA